MIKELILSYFSFIKETRKESLIAISAGIIAAISETIAIYYLSEIIKSLEYFKINVDINSTNFNLSKELFIFLIFSILASFIFFIS